MSTKNTDRCATLILTRLTIASLSNALFTLFCRGRARFFNRVFNDTPWDVQILGYIFITNPHLCPGLV